MSGPWWYLFFLAVKSGTIFGSFVLALLYLVSSLNGRANRTTQAWAGVMAAMCIQGVTEFIANVHSGRPRYSDWFAYWYWLGCGILSLTVWGLLIRHIVFRWSLKR
jgi:hypothetical protein